MYCVYEEEIQVEKDQSYFTYGIEVHGGEEKVSNISVVRSEVEALADWMNRMQLSPVHLTDAVEDWLVDR